MKNPTFQVRLPQEYIDKIKQSAKSKGTTYQKYIMAAVDFYNKHEETVKNQEEQAEKVRFADRLSATIYKKRGSISPSSLEKVFGGWITRHKDFNERKKLFQTFNSNQENFGMVLAPYLTLEEMKKAQEKIRAI